MQWNAIDHHNSLHAQTHKMKNILFYLSHVEMSTWNALAPTKGDIGKTHKRLAHFILENTKQIIICLIKSMCMVFYSSPTPFCP